MLRLGLQVTLEFFLPQQLRQEKVKDVLPLADRLGKQCLVRSAPYELQTCMRKTGAAAEAMRLPHFLEEIFLPEFLLQEGHFGMIRRSILLEFDVLD